MKDWVYDFYKSNQEFHDWVDTLCKGEDIGVFEALNDVMTEVVAEYYRDKEKEKGSENS